MVMNDDLESIWSQISLRAQISDKKISVFLPENGAREIRNKKQEC
jgi:hypothetical protein